jgi:lantibiotic biosynthesis protein
VREEKRVARQVFTPLAGAPALARIPLLPLDSPEADAEGAGAVHPVVAEGMFLASRQAAAIESGAAAGQPLDGRAAATARSYSLRARWRPTPHGVFAGVARAPFTGRASALTMAGGHRARTVPHPAWLAGVAAAVLGDPGVLELLTLHADTLTVQRGGRLEREQQAGPGRDGVRLVTARASDASRLVMAACAHGATWAEVLAAVAARWPTVPGETVRAMVLELARCGFLLTDLLPEDCGDDPLGHLLQRIPGAHPLREGLRVIRASLAGADQFPPGAPQRLAALAAAQQAADRLLHLDQPPLCADVALDADLALPARLAQEAADAAGALWRIGAPGSPLDAWHERFLARYGRNRPVRLLDAADPVTGIGADAAAGEPPLPAQMVAVLASLLTAAAAGQRTEIDLDAATVEALAAACGSGGESPPPTAEIYVRVIADERAEAGGAGRLRLAVCPGGHTQTAGSSSGRFASLLPGLGSTASKDPAIAELAVRARTPVGTTLAAPTGFRRCRVSLGIPARPGDLEPGDLLLASDGHRLSLWSQRLGRGVVPVLYSRLSPQLLPPVARLLRMMASSGCRPLRAWSWGPLAGTPFQPRVCYRGTILAPARWTLPPLAVSAAGSAGGWDAAVGQWRSTAVPPPPRVVVVQDHDRALPVDLDRPDDRALLRRYVRRGTLAVAEQPGGTTQAQGVVTSPAGKHALELVISLARGPAGGRPAPAGPPVPVRARQPGEGLHLPGGDWLSLVIRTPPSCQDDVIARAGAIAQGLAFPWFWLRYSDHAGPYLRIRFHGEPAALAGRVLPAMAALSGELIAARLASGLSAEPYEQETERYGGTPATMTAAEQVFTADSRLVLAILAATRDADERIILAAMSAAAIARALNAGEAALHGRHVDRATRHKLDGMRARVRAAAATGHAGLAASPESQEWADRDTALATYHLALPAERRAQCASSLIHMHVNRLIGHDSLEPLIRALAADLLFSTAPAAAPPLAAGASQ